MKKILFVGSEFYPYIKTGGLGDAIASLLRAVQVSGKQATILLPGYRAITENIVHVHEVHEVLIPFSVVIRARLKKVTLKRQNAPLWVLDSAPFFHQPGGIYDETDNTEGHLNTLRFAMLAWAASELACGTITNWKADIVHCHDWHAALVPVFIRKKYSGLPGGGLLDDKRPKSLLTIHNLAFQGHCYRQYLGILGLEAFNVNDAQLNNPMTSFLALGIAHADRISTVSPTYAKEILSEEYGCGLQHKLASCGVRGILNGVDYNVWHPQTDPALDNVGYSFDADTRSSIKLGLQRDLGLKPHADIPLLSFTNRLTHQKMADVLIEAIPRLMEKGVQITAMGEGQDEYVEQFIRAAGSHKGQFSYVEKFSEVMEHRIHAGADICLSPSRFEPCGLNPLYAMRYGSIPVVRATGGLCDTVVDANLQSIRSGDANGITFKNANLNGLLSAIDGALTLFSNKPEWMKLQKNAMNASFLWQKAAIDYCEIYDELTKKTDEKLVIAACNTQDQADAGTLAVLQDEALKPQPELPAFAPLLNAVGAD